MTEQNNDILFEVRDGIGRVTFNRPQARNAFTFQMYERLAEICEEANDDRAIKVLIFTGAGDKAFAAGNGHQPVPRVHDAAGRHRLRGAQRPRARRAGKMPRADHRGDRRRLHRRRRRHRGLLRSAHRRPRPRKFGFPIARTLGNCLSMANYGRLAALLGPARVKDIIFTARLVEAQEALALGLLSEVVEDVTALQQRADELARLLAGHAPLTLRATKEAMRRLQPTAFRRRGRGPHPDVLHEQGFSRGPRRVPHQAHAAVGGGVGALPRQRRDDARPGARALVERGEVVLLVRRMHAVVVEAEADQQRVHAEHVLEIADDRDRAARADRDRLRAPFLGQRRARLGERRIFVGDLQRRAAGVIDELGLGVGRKLLAHEGAE